MSNVIFRKYTVVKCVEDSVSIVPKGSIGVFMGVKNYQYIVAFPEKSNHPMLVTELKEATISDVFKYILYRIKRLLGIKING